MSHLRVIEKLLTPFPSRTHRAQGRPKLHPCFEAEQDLHALILLTGFRSFFCDDDEEEEGKGLECFVSFIFDDVGFTIDESRSG